MIKEVLVFTLDLYRTNRSFSPFVFTGDVLSIKYTDLCADSLVDSCTALPQEYWLSSATSTWIDQAYYLSPCARIYIPMYPPSNTSSKMNYSACASCVPVLPLIVVMLYDNRPLPFSLLPFLPTFFPPTSLDDAGLGFCGWILGILMSWYRERQQHTWSDLVSCLNYAESGWRLINRMALLMRKLTMTYLTEVLHLSTATVVATKINV